MYLLKSKHMSIFGSWRFFMTLIGGDKLQLVCTGSHGTHYEVWEDGKCVAEIVYVGRNGFDWDNILDKRQN